MGSCSAYGRDEKCIQSFGEKPEGKRPHGRPRHRWEERLNQTATVRESGKESSRE